MVSPATLFKNASNIHDDIKLNLHQEVVMLLLLMKMEIGIVHVRIITSHIIKFLGSIVASIFLQQ